MKYRGPMLAGPIMVLVGFVIKKPRTVTRNKPSVKPDLDNFLKAVLDAANGILWQDDGQIVHISTAKTYGKKGSIAIVVSKPD